MARIAILTPDPGDAGFHTRWREVLDRTAAPLRRAGFEVQGRSWSEADGLACFDLVLPLLVWGYHRAPALWAARVEAWRGEGLRVRNPPSVLTWNADKAYLGTLAGRGAAVVPTLFVERVTETALLEAAEQFGTERLVAKPRMSSTAWQTIRWSPGASLADGPAGAAMIQPYLPAIETSGEVSLLYFGGCYSHAIRKLPQPGDFRVQPEYDGVISVHQASDDERAAAAAILAAAGEELLYARIDLVREPAGRPILIELELIEPDLYLGFDPGGGAAFADAASALLARP